MEKAVSIELVYITQNNQMVLNLHVPAYATIREVIQRSGVLQQCPEIDLEHGSVGIFNELRKLEDKVQDGDRVEIYRPLHTDPKDARRKRAQESN